LRKNMTSVLRKTRQEQQEDSAKRKLNSRKLTIFKFSVLMT
jgi:hypothetical protein